MTSAVYSIIHHPLFFSVSVVLRVLHQGRNGFILKGRVQIGLDAGVEFMDGAGPHAVAGAEAVRHCDKQQNQHFAVKTKTPVIPAICEISISLIAPAKCSTVIYIIFACSIP